MTWRRRLKRRFGIAAPRVAVHTHVPWYMRWSLLLVIFSVVAAIAWAAYDLGRGMGGYDSSQASAEQARLAETVAHLQDENESLRDQLAVAERQMQIEQSTHGNLAGQIKVLSDENALLKEDLALFQTLMTSGGGDAGSGITINRFRVRQEALPGEYRYQLLVVQARTRGKEFQGRLQLVVDLQQDGQQQVLTLPAQGEQRADFDLSFKFYQRVEGAFRVPESAKVTRVQVRVLENGVEQPRSSQTVVLS
jgi:hypothetical protein